MPQDLGHGRTLDAAVGTVGVGPDELGPMPDDILKNPDAGLVDPREWFERPDAPFELEIGSGKGTFLIQQAGIDPETNYLGIEWAYEFYLYAADRVRRRRDSGAHRNVRLLCADATSYLRWRCPPEICRVIHLYFSDPWPKKRHHKKRVVQDQFLADVWRTLVPGGELRVVTDHEDLWRWDLARFDHWLHDTHASDARTRLGLARAPFEWREFEKPHSSNPGELVGTNFERKFREEGREFFAGVLRKLPTRLGETAPGSIA